MAGEGETNAPFVIECVKAFSDRPSMEKRLQIGGVFNNRYVVKMTIGVGCFGRVYKVTDMNQNCDVAMKVLQIPTPNGLMRVSKEVKLWNKIRKLDRENKSCILLKLDDFVADGNALMVFELMEKSLRQYINHTQGVSLQVVQKIGLQILEPLQFLVSAKVIHADLKPDNIMFKKVSTLEIKVIDLGNFLTIGKKIKPTLFGAVKYRPPEAILFLPYNFGSDIWCVGCVLFELRTGRGLFDGSTLEEQLYRMTKALGPISDALLSEGERTNDFYCRNEETKSYSLKECNNFPQFDFESLNDCLTEGNDDKGGGANFSDLKLKSFLDVITKMLKYDPSERISAAEAKDSSFFKTMKDEKFESGGDVKAG